MNTITTIRTTRTRTRQGFSLVEMAMVLGLGALGIAGTLEVLDQVNSQMKDSSAAGRLEEVLGAADKYIQANYQALVNTVPMGGVLAIPVGRATPGGAVPAGPGTLPSLQGGGFLSASYVDRNSYGQFTSLLVRQPSPGVLEGLVTAVGGQVVRDQDLGRIALKVRGARGGVIQTRTVPGVAPGTIQGVGGGWSDTVAAWGGGAVAPSAGRPVAQVFYGRTNGQDDYLHRHAVAGQPDATTMHADIQMNGDNVARNLVGAGNIDTTSLSNSRGPNVNVSASMVASGSIGTDGLDPARTTPSGFHGVRTTDVYAGGTVGAGEDGLRWAAYLNSQGDAVASRDVLAGRNVGITGRLNWTAGGYMESARGYLAAYGAGLSTDTAVSSPIYYDSANHAYYLQPASMSRVAGVYADRLYSAGDAGVGNNLSVGNNVQAGNSIIANGSLEAGRNLYVAGTSSLSGDTTMGASLGVAQDATVGGATTTGSLASRGTTDLYGRTIVWADPATGEALTVVGSGLVGKDFVVIKNAAVGGAVQAGNVYSNGVVSTAHDAGEGAACNTGQVGDGSLYGSLARGGGRLLFCDGGTWRLP